MQTTKITTESKKKISASSIVESHFKTTIEITFKRLNALAIIIFLNSEVFNLKKIKNDIYLIQYVWDVSTYHSRVILINFDGSKQPWKKRKTQI